MQTSGVACVAGRLGSCGEWRRAPRGVGPGAGAPTVVLPVRARRMPSDGEGRAGGRGRPGVGTRGRRDGRVAPPPPPPGRSRRLSSAGILASETFAGMDLPALRRYRPLIAEVGRRRCLDPALMAALISRETHAGAALRDGWDLPARRFGLMQVNGAAAASSPPSGTGGPRPGEGRRRRGRGRSGADRVPGPAGGPPASIPFSGRGNRGPGMGEEDEDGGGGNRAVPRGGRRLRPRIPDGGTEARGRTTGTVSVERRPRVGRHLERREGIGPGSGPGPPARGRGGGTRPGRVGRKADVPGPSPRAFPSWRRSTSPWAAGTARSTSPRPPGSSATKSGKFRDDSRCGRRPSTSKVAGTRPRPPSALRSSRARPRPVPSAAGLGGRSDPRAPAGRGRASPPALCASQALAEPRRDQARHRNGATRGVRGLKRRRLDAGTMVMIIMSVSAKRFLGAEHCSKRRGRRRTIASSPVGLPVFQVPPFADEVAEAQRGAATRPGSHRRRSGGFEPAPSASPEVGIGRGAAGGARPGPPPPPKSFPRQGRRSAYSARSAVPGAGSVRSGHGEGRSSPEEPESFPRAKRWGERGGGGPGLGGPGFRSRPPCDGSRSLPGPRLENAGPRRDPGVAGPVVTITGSGKGPGWGVRGHGFDSRLCHLSAV
uniref:Lysozyme g n=1 Tax=Ornithorhynchus anatinus TaxID=9258 RepID=A0A6I8NTG7_ORNAN